MGHGPNGVSHTCWGLFAVCEETRKVLDYHVLFKTCNTCLFWKGREKSTPVEHATIKLHHKDDCQINHSGSSGKWKFQGLHYFMAGPLQSITSAIGTWIVTETVKHTLQLRTSVVKLDSWPCSEACVHEFA